MQSSFCVPQISGSPIKSIIVPSFFSQWAKMVMSHARKVGNKVGLLDFYSGSGKNEDGSEGAPLQVLGSVVKDEVIADMLVSVFCDKDPKNIIKLRQSVSKLDGIESLLHEPHIEKGSSSEELIYSLQKIRLLPSLVLLDLLKIKDLNLDLIVTHMKEGNFDGVFLLHYSLLEKIIENPFKAKHLETAFGKIVADKLRSVADRLNPQQKESFIVNTFLDSLKKLKGYHSVILNYNVGRDSYYFVFVTRYMPRYRLMNEVIRINGYSQKDIVTLQPVAIEKSNFSIQTGLF